MNTQKVERVVSAGSKEHLALKMIGICFFACLAWLSPASVYAEEISPVQENPPSNEEFLRESIRSLLDDAFADFPDNKSKLLLLKQEGEHPAGWLLEDELVSLLMSFDKQVSLRSGAENNKSGESLLLFYRIIDLSLTYPEVKRRGFLGGRMLTRRAGLNLAFRLEDAATGKVLWSGKEKKESSDLIERKMNKSVNNKNYPFLSPTLPDDPQSRYLEPALVVTVVGGLIYLFFANR